MGQCSTKLNRNKSSYHPATLVPSPHLGKDRGDDSVHVTKCWPSKERDLREALLVAPPTAQMPPYSLGGDARRKIDEEFLVLWDANKVSVI